MARFNLTGKDMWPLIPGDRIVSLYCIFKDQFAVSSLVYLFLICRFGNKLSKCNNSNKRNWEGYRESLLSAAFKYIFIMLCINKYFFFNHKRFMLNKELLSLNKLVTVYHNNNKIYRNVVWNFSHLQCIFGFSDLPEYFALFSTA